MELRCLSLEPTWSPCCRLRPPSSPGRLGRHPAPPSEPWTASHLCGACPGGEADATPGSQTLDLAPAPGCQVERADADIRGSVEEPGTFALIRFPGDSPAHLGGEPLAMVLEVPSTPLVLGSAKHPGTGTFRAVSSISRVIRSSGRAHRLRPRCWVWKRRSSATSNQCDPGKSLSSPQCPRP